jgi:hypothetical protein
MIVRSINAEAKINGVGRTSFTVVHVLFAYLLMVIVSATPLAQIRLLLAINE